MAKLRILEDPHELPSCPRCKAQVKFQRYSKYWIAYEPKPMNRRFLRDHPCLLEYGDGGQFVFIPHHLCCGADDIPDDPGLRGAWQRNCERSARFVRRGVAEAG